MMIDLLIDLAVYAALLVALTIAGNVFCRLVLRFNGAVAAPKRKAAPASQQADADPQHTVASSFHGGRTIGSLERLLIMLGMTANSWEMIVAVIALKTIARYQELDRRIEAEYFLIGSLASIFWAIVVTLLALWYDQSFGLGISRAVIAFRGG